MSHSAYDEILAQAIDQLKENNKIEKEPQILNDVGKPQFDDWPDDEVFQHLAVLYIKYIDIYKKLEECFDQMVHPQKRIFIKKTLECTICRICELKYKIIQYNPRKKSIYVHLDQLLFDLKYDPSVIEIPVPRYFREDDRIPVDVVFKEKVQRDTGEKKKKKKTVSKKGKKKKVDDEEKKVPALPLAEKLDLINGLLMEYHISHTDDVEVEVQFDPFTLDIDIFEALLIILKNDQGRQGRERLLLIFKTITQDAKLKRLLRAQAEGSIPKQTRTTQENESCKLLQQRMRGILARKQVKGMREEEMGFLGMSAKKPKMSKYDPKKTEI